MNRKSLAFILVAALAVTASVAFAKSNRLTGGITGDPDSQLGMTVKFKDDKPNIVKNIDVRLTYSCDTNGDLFYDDPSILTAELPLKLKVRGPNQYGNRFIKKIGYEFEGRKWDINGIVNDKGTKITGNLLVTGENNAGQRCRSYEGPSGPQFKVKK